MTAASSPAAPATLAQAVVSVEAERATDYARTAALAAEAFGGGSDRFTAGGLRWPYGEA